MATRKFSSTGMGELALGKLMPTRSRPSPSVRGRRPVAMRMTSASMSATFSTAVFILKVTPRFSIVLRRRLAISPSRAGRHSFRYSITVTSEPKRLKTEANSMPMTPAPMMARRLGRVSRFSKPVLSTTRGSSMPLMGSHFVSEPVAMMMFLAATESLPTLTVLASTSWARPRTSVMLGCERMVSTPARSWGTT